MSIVRSALKRYAVQQLTIVTNRTHHDEKSFRVYEVHDTTQKRVFSLCCDIITKPLDY